MQENLSQFTNRFHSTTHTLTSKPNDLRLKFTRRNQVPKMADRHETHKLYGTTLWQREQKFQTTSQPRSWDSLALSKETKQEEERNRSFFSRPEYLLKKYLHRKEKLNGMPVFNPEQSEANLEQPSKTLTDFLIKKPKKGMAVMPQPVHNLQGDYSVQQEAVQSDKVEENRMQFTASKNLYKMSFQQLQASMRWKKQFLELLNKKIRQNRTSQMRHRF